MSILFLFISICKRRDFFLYIKLNVKLHFRFFFLIELLVGSEDLNRVIQNGKKWRKNKLKKAK